MASRPFRASTWCYLISVLPRVHVLDENLAKKMPSPASSDNNKYNDVCNLSLVHTQLTAVLEEPQLSIPSYILAYHEFHKFFTSLGAIFGFVASDVKEKIEIMEMFQAGANSTHFKTVRQMMNHEKDLLNDLKYISGSRTILRLHRALLFIALFLEDVNTATMGQSLTSLAKKAYSDTLGNYHPWLIQKAALLAMHALPNKEGLLNQIKGPDETVEMYNDLLPKVVETMKEVHRQTQLLYEEYGFTNLP